MTLRDRSSFWLIIHNPGGLYPSAIRASASSKSRTVLVQADRRFRWLKCFRHQEGQKNVEKYFNICVKNAISKICHYFLDSYQYRYCIVKYWNASNLTQLATEGGMEFSLSSSIFDYLTLHLVPDISVCGSGEGRRPHLHTVSVLTAPETVTSYPVEWKLTAPDVLQQSPARSSAFFSPSNHELTALASHVMSLAATC